MMLHVFSLAVLLASLIACSPKKASKDPAKNDTTVPDSIMDEGTETSVFDTMKSDNTVSAEWDPGAVSYEGEQAIVYKTKKDYSNYVPVKMNDEKTKIVSYPNPMDLFYKDKLAYPVILQEGYLLDNRGITKNSVFIDLTYEAYSKLDQAPLLPDMMKMIIDKDPFLEIYSLGMRARFKDEVREINEIIDRGAIKKFKRIK